MIDLKPNAGLNLQLVKPARCISFSHSFFSLSFPFKRVNIAKSKFSFNSVTSRSSPASSITTSMIITFPSFPFPEIASLHFFNIFIECSSSQLCRTHCKIIHTNFSYIRSTSGKFVT